MADDKFELYIITIWQFILCILFVIIVAWIVGSVRYERIKAPDWAMPSPAISIQEDANK